MSKLTIGFSRPSSKFAIFGRAIMLYEGVNYSHCYIKYTTGSGSVLICQASKGMLNFMSVPAFLLHNVVVEEFEIDVTPDQLAFIKKKSMDKAGLPYSVKQIVGIVVAGIFKLKTNPFDSDPDTFVCSEWVGETLQSLGVKIDKDLGLITPKDIREIVLNTIRK